MSNHEQSIGAENNQPVDGIAGSNPGTQQPSGAHVDAGNAGADAGQCREIAPESPRGQNGVGAVRPSGITGVMGSVKRARHMLAGQVDHIGWASHYNGSLSRAGQRISVKVGCGSPGARAA
ncbi:hypothetical protein [Massilia sp. TSP1-1-2]|uniref:hypothetical protein n=1 Tax=unclassified Massilia TaxID=2609279 RepID=UPI003CF44D81